MPNILVVDDSPVDLQLFEGILSRVPDLNVIQAENGEDALAKIEDWGIELVVTDLQMPGMDGLQLVEAIRDEFPEVPTILITGIGSEEIASQALIAGAAGYVPKNKAAELLLPTVQGVLEILFAEHSFEKLLGRATESRFVFDLDNDESYFPAILDLCGQMLDALSPLDRIDRLRVLVAVEHALSNALYRGNLGISPSQNVHSAPMQPGSELAELVEEQKAQFESRSINVTLDIGSFDFTCRIRDEGPGFQVEMPAALASPAGRGLVLMHTFMDRLEFNRSGNEVTLYRSWDTGGSGVHTVDDMELLKNPIAPGAMNLGVFMDCHSDHQVELVNPKQLIGRESTCHIMLDYADIADHHCQLVYNSGFWYFKSVGDQPIMLNGQPQGQGKLLPSDRLGLGTREYRIDYHIHESIR
ncbi:MAG: response regulator [Pirellulaceae bacterium]